MTSLTPADLEPPYDLYGKSCALQGQFSALASRKKRESQPKPVISVETLDQLFEAGQLRTLRGRRFTYRGFRRMQTIVEAHQSEGRTKISERICRALSWRQPNGWLKDRACRDVLRRLEALGVLRLPKKLTMPSKEADKRPRKVVKLPVGVDDVVSKMPTNLELLFAKGNDLEPIWNALVSKYHYLGHRIQVGRCLKYLIKGDDRLLGAISFSSPAWKLSTRDSLLKVLGLSERDAADLVINNSRFLILPSVRVPHLASKALALASRQVAKDWSWFYSIDPLIAETFVEQFRFEGTCYRAANWLNVGTTKGFAKVGSSHHNSQPPKLVFVYGLTSEYRQKLSKAVKDLTDVK